MDKNIHPHIMLAGAATLGPKGQVVIPVEIREKMGIQPGDKLVALYMEDKKTIGFVSEKCAQGMIDKMGEQLNALRSIVGEEKN